MKKIKIFVGVFLCMNLFTISGCDKVVHSAVECDYCIMHHIPVP